MMRWIYVFLVLAVVVGCGDNDLGLDKRRPNAPPETTLASGPPDSTDKTVYKVQLFWSGTDRDGTVDHYDFIMVDHPPIQSKIKGDSLDPERVVVEIPMPDDPRWTGTTSTDSTFITLADTLRRDPQPGPGETADEVRCGSGLLVDCDNPYERWHTFFVRAVDNEGDVDPTPDYRSFNSRNIAPTVSLTAPIKAGSEFEGPSVIVFNWVGQDPVGDGTFKDPVASRYVIIPSPIDIEAPYKYTNFPDSLYTLPVGYEWSPWTRWDALDGSGKRAIVRGLAEQGEFPGSGFYIAAVQALDEAGAITPVFDWSTPGRNNVSWVRVNSAAAGPILTVQEEFLGTQTFVGGSKPVKLDIAAGQPLNFRWSGDASRYGGEIVAFRYGWNIRDPNDDQQWDQNWSGSLRRAPTRSFNTGSHRFFVQVRDNAETVTSAVYELTVHTVTRTRDLLFVDDSDHLQDFQAEAREDARWLGIMNGLAEEWGFLFEESRDVFDVAENRNEEPPIQKVFDYKTVVWINRSNQAGVSALRNLALFFDPIPVRNQNAAKSFNFLNIYLANKGSMWISGFRPARQIWPQAEQGRPVNVTNWDDPIEPHPFIDSVGTISLLYKMGVEMFDVGSESTHPQRRTLPHFCRGFDNNAARPDSFESNLTDGHSHFVRIPYADGNAPESELTDKTYVTTQDPNFIDHSHTVTVTRDDFLAMRDGFSVTLESDPTESPDYEIHSHVFQDVTDRAGLWGAPRLITGPSWAQAPSPNARTNIEIYNMPIQMTTVRPNLIPRLGISTVPYLYLSDPSVQETENRRYPLTADRQPALIMAKGSVLEPFYTRAFCGFEPALLNEVSHRQLTEYIIVRHFRLGYFDR